MNGLQTRVESGGAVCLVQTQDKGPTAQYVETLVYASGRIVTSKRTFYTPFLDRPDPESMIRQIMEEQHAALVEDVRLGRLDRLLAVPDKG